MKKTIYTLTITIVSLLMTVSCSDDSDYHVIKTNGSDITDMTIYTGSANGGELYSDPKMNIGTVQYSIIQEYLSAQYNASLYSKLTMEFSADRLTYTDSDDRKLISSYIFRNDSLLINTTDSIHSQRFVALGSNIDNLYREQSLIRARKIGHTPKDTTYVRDYALTKDSVENITGFTIPEMRQDSDLLIWVNIKYLFK